MSWKNKVDDKNNFSWNLFSFGLSLFGDRFSSILSSIYLFTNFDRIFLWVIYNWTAWWYMGWFPLVIGPFKDHSLTFWCHCRIFLIRKRLGQFTHGHLHLHQCVEKKNNSISHFRPEFNFGRFFFVSARSRLYFARGPSNLSFFSFFRDSVLSSVGCKKRRRKKGILESGEKEKTRPIDKTKTQGTPWNRNEPDRWEESDNFSNFKEHCSTTWQKSNLPKFGRNQIDTSKMDLNLIRTRFDSKQINYIKMRKVNFNWKINFLH